MISIALCGNRLQSIGLCDSFAIVELEGLPIMFGRVTTSDLAFDPQAAENRSKVFIKMQAFSCNYRDKGLILAFARICKPNAYCFVGSEFVGEVVAVGSDVMAFRPGDRVIGNNSWPDSGVEGVLPHEYPPTTPLNAIEPFTRRS